MTRAASGSPPRRTYPSLRNRLDFQRVLGSGRRHSRGSVTAVVAVVAEGIELRPHVGLVAGRKVGGAVQRNRARRRVRAALARIELPPGHDVVVIMSSHTLDAPFDDLVRDLAVAIGSLS